MEWSEYEMEKRMKNEKERQRKKSLCEAGRESEREREKERERGQRKRVSKGERGVVRDYKEKDGKGSGLEGKLFLEGIVVLS